MKPHFRDIRVFVWDFDQTLYPPNPALSKAMRQAGYDVIVRHTGIDREKAIKMYKKEKKVSATGTTEIISRLSGITVTDAAFEREQICDRTHFLKYDQRIVDMFTRFRHFRHIILGNGIRSEIIEALGVIGLSVNIFELIVTSETVGGNKPSELGFRYILSYTGIPASQHIMIGDREQIDLAPAKKLGFATCLVWNTTGGVYADLVLPTVYDLLSMIDS